jgi:hypothetical protein
MDDREVGAIAVSNIGWQSNLGISALSSKSSIQRNAFFRGVPDSVQLQFPGKPLLSVDVNLIWSGNMFAAF